RHSKEDEEKKEVPLSPPIQRQMEEEDQEEIKRKPLSGQFSEVPLITRQPAALVENTLHRLCATCASDARQEELQSRGVIHRQHVGQRPSDRDDEKEQRVQPNGSHAADASVTNQVAESINALNGSGRPLPDSTRAFFEPRFGADFSQVRVYT